jgi:hypothetical protein
MFYGYLVRFVVFGILFPVLSTLDTMSDGFVDMCDLLRGHVASGLQDDEGPGIEPRPSLVLDQWQKQFALG